VDEAGSVEEAVLTFAAELALEEGDTRLPLVALTRRLAMAVDEGHNLAAVARELRTNLAWLAEGQPGGVLDEIRTARSRRRLELLLDDIA
jgi:hypothetical protein